MKAIVVAVAALCLALPPGLETAQAAGDPAHDDAECSQIATRQTGFDPARPPQQAVASPQVAGSGARLRGAAAGAVIGGASGGDAGKGAAAGAVAGGVAQRSRNRRSARAANDAMAQQQSAWQHARAACMSARGHGGG